MNEKRALPIREAPFALKHDFGYRVTMIFRMTWLWPVRMVRV